MIDLYVMQVLQPALHNDVAFNIPPIENKYDPIYSSLIYKKGEDKGKCYIVGTHVHCLKSRYWKSYIK